MDSFLYCLGSSLRGLDFKETEWKEKKSSNTATHSTHLTEFFGRLAF